MSKFDKLLEKLFSLDKDIRYKDLEKILAQYGYAHYKGKGSHQVFKKDDKVIVIPKHNTIKTVYIKLVKKAVEEEVENEQDS